MSGRSTGKGNGAPLSSFGNIPGSTGLAALAGLRLRKRGSVNAGLGARNMAQHATFEVAAGSSREIFGTNSDSSEPGLPRQSG